MLIPDQLVRRQVIVALTGYDRLLRAEAKRNGTSVPGWVPELAAVLTAEDERHTERQRDAAERGKASSQVRSRRYRQRRRERRQAAA